MNLVLERKLMSGHTASGNSERGKGGKKLTSALFKEEGDKNAPYSLKIWRTKFLSHKESTGYLCAQDVLSNIPEEDRWKEWKRIFGNTKLYRLLEEWREELAVLIRAEAESKLASDCDPKDITRIRFILTRKIPGHDRAGRPKKDGKPLTKKEQAQSVVKNYDTKRMDTVIKMGQDDNQSE